MKKFKLSMMIVLAVSIVLAALVGFRAYWWPGTATEYFAHLPRFNNMEDLVLTASDIVRAEVLGERQERLRFHADSTGTSLFTVTQIRILEIFQGNIQPESIIEVRRFPGIRNHNLRLVTGDEVILFLQAFVVENTQASLMAPYEAVYRFPFPDENSTLNLSAYVGLEFENMYQRRHALAPQPLPLTIGDLIQIWEVNFGYSTNRSAA